MVFIEEQYREGFPGKGSISFSAIVEYFGIDLDNFRQRSAVVEGQLLCAVGSSCPVYFKLYSYRKSWWQRFLRRPKTWREVRNLKYFASVGIPSPEVVAWGKRRTWWGKVEFDFIITKAVPEAHLLKDFLMRRCPDVRKPGDAAMRRQIFSQIARGARALHDRSFFHQDLKWRNLLVSAPRGNPPKVYWIDCPSGYHDFFGFNRLRGAIKDLATLDEVAIKLCSLRERILFLKDYLGGAMVSFRLRECAVRVDHYRRTRLDDVDRIELGTEVSVPATRLHEEVSR